MRVRRDGPYAGRYPWAGHTIEARADTERYELIREGMSGDEIEREMRTVTYGEWTRVG